MLKVNYNKNKHSTITIREPKKSPHQKNKIHITKPHSRIIAKKI